MEDPFAIKDAFGRTKAQQNAIGAALLLKTFGILAAGGWLHPRLIEPWAKEPHAKGRTIREAVWAAHDGRRNPIDTVYALRLVERVEPLHHLWEQRADRRQIDVMRMLQAAIALGGQEPPRMPKRFGPKRRGGWNVSHGAVH